MKWLLMILMSILIVGCDNKTEEETDKERKRKHDEFYRTPPPSDRSKDKGF